MQNYFKSNILKKLSLFFKTFWLKTIKYFYFTCCLNLVYFNGDIIEKENKKIVIFYPYNIIV